jgi:glycosyltransferase involved in cell wall biosynthesis
MLPNGREKIKTRSIANHMKIDLSVIIIVKNEEKRIEECIQSVYGWVGEIIVVDDESTDRTVELARKFTDKVFTRKMELEGKQRNFGVSKASNKWVMMLDCDERVTPELREEIIDLIQKNDPQAGGYWIKQICYLGNKRLHYGGWGAEHARIYHKERAAWREDPHDIVHPALVVDPKYTSPILKHCLVHYNFKDLEDFVAKTNRYTTLEAVKWHFGGKAKKMTMGRALWRTFDRFFRRYIRKQGYRDGFHGFVAAALSGLYELLAYAKLREIQESGFYTEHFKADIKE